MVDQVGGGGDSLSPAQARRMYEAEYKHAADLFQKTLTAYSKSDNEYQKEEFKHVMNESLQVLNDAATALRRNDLLNQNNQIEQDYNAFQADDSKTSKLDADLNKAKRL